MKKLSLILAMMFSAGFVAAQTQEQFDTAYWLSQPTAVQEIKNLPPFSAERINKGVELTKLGYCVDQELMMLSAISPWNTMKLREQYGYTWLPCFGQPNVLPPGIEFPGVAKYDPLNPPKASFKVSSKLEDYPPFVKPPVAVPGTSADLCKPGAQQTLTIFSVLLGDTCSNGTTYSSGAVKWVKKIVATPFGISQWWEKVQ